MLVFGPKWTGPIFIATGALLLIYQSYLWTSIRLIESWLLGGGFALMFVGAVAWFYYFDDKRKDAWLNDLRPRRDSEERRFTSDDGGDMGKNAAKDDL